MNSLVEVDLSTDRPRDYFVEEKGGVIDKTSSSYFNINFGVLDTVRYNMLYLPNVHCLTFTVSL